MPMNLPRHAHARRSGVGLPTLGLIISLFVALLGVTAAPAKADSGTETAPAAGPDYRVASTIATTDTGRDQAVDEKRGRIYVPIDRGREKPGAITWIDTATGERSNVDIELKTAEPHALTLSKDGSQLLVVHYRTGVMSVIDLTKGVVQDEIQGMPRFPGGITVDTDTGTAYVYDGKALLPVNPSTGKVSEPISVSKEAYPLIKDAVYDSANKFIWVAEGRGNLITGYSTITTSWTSSVAIPMAEFKYDGERLGGRVSRLAIDETLGHLYVVVDPVRGDAWKNSKVVTIDTKTGKHLGKPIEVGERNNGLRVNPRTHEVYALNGFGNSVSVIDPASWTVKNTIDFTAAGVTTGVGVAFGDVGSLAVSADGNRLSVTHPYKKPRVSLIERSGQAATPTTREVTPGQDEPPVTETPTNPDWDGPAPEEPADTKDSTNDATLTWSINEYMKAWSSEALGSVSKDGYDYRFANGRATRDPSTGVLKINWKHGLRIRHYPGLAPDVITTLGNPELTVDDAGRGKLTFDVAWSVQPTERSDGYRRVALATFTKVTKTTDGDKVTLTVAPEFEGRTFDAGDKVAPNSYPHDFLNWMNEGMRAWWFTTGASMDPKKAPNPFTVTFTNLAGGSDKPDPKPEPKAKATKLAASAARMTYGRAGAVSVKVSSLDGGKEPTGTVSAAVGAHKINASLKNGTAVLRLPAKALAPGARSIRLTYSGIAGSFASSTSTAVVSVAKAAPTLRFVGTKKLKRGRIAIYTLRASAVGVKPRGVVRVTVAGKRTVVKLNAKGTAVAKLRIPKNRKPGRKTVTAAYQGDSFVVGKTVRRVVTVTR